MNFKLPNMIKAAQLCHFVETGTGTGYGLQHAADTVPSFRRLLSCEIEPRLAIENTRRFADDPRVQVFCSDSLTFLSWVCRVLPYNDPILFWLDAHFPGADYGLRKYDSITEDATRLPLELELREIIQWRANSHDVFICDDLRIYRDGPFAHGNIPAGIRAVCPAERNIDFVHHLVDKTHNVTELYDHEGYLLITPKGLIDAA